LGIAANMARFTEDSERFMKCKELKPADNGEIIFPNNTEFATSVDIKRDTITDNIDIIDAKKLLVVFPRDGFRRRFCPR
jgi:hypothetical protein